MRLVPLLLALGACALGCRRPGAPVAEVEEAKEVNEVEPAEKVEEEDAETLRWNRIFSEGTLFNPKPSRFLVDTVRGRKPGAALDIGIGQGRNALYLASQGWDVTGIDISTEGIRQAQEAAKAAGLKLQTVVTQEETWDFGEDRWDLVVYIYMPDEPPVARIRRALRRGGLVVIEFFLWDPAYGNGFRKGELPALFKEGFQVLRYDEVVDVADWGLKRRTLVRFVAQKR